MPQRTKIAWATHTSNPIRFVDRNGTNGWHCEKVSSGCAHCYAEAINNRFGTGAPFARWNRDNVSIDMDALNRELSAILRMRKPRDGSPVRIFVGDMTDIFGEWVPFEVIDSLFAVFALRPDITFIILTKRPERVAEYKADLNKRSWSIRDAGHNIANEIGEHVNFALPFKNIWLGASASTQRDYDNALRWLSRIIAAVRLVSLEPLLEEIDTRMIDVDWPDYKSDDDPGEPLVCPSGKGACLDWVITGGESGPKARPCSETWIRSIAEQCKVAGVPCFIKQDSGPRPGRQGLIDDATWAIKEFPVATQ